MVKPSGKAFFERGCAGIPAHHTGMVAAVGGPYRSGDGYLLPSGRSLTLPKLDGQMANPPSFEI